MVAKRKSAIANPGLVVSLTVRAPRRLRWAAPREAVAADDQDIGSTDVQISTRARPRLASVTGTTI